VLISGSAATSRPSSSMVSWGFFRAVRTWNVMSRKVGNETTSPDRSRAMSSRILKLNWLLIGAWPSASYVRPWCRQCIALAGEVAGGHYRPASAFCLKTIARGGIAGHRDAPTAASR